MSKPEIISIFLRDLSIFSLPLKQKIFSNALLKIIQTLNQGSIVLIDTNIVSFLFLAFFLNLKSLKMKLKFRI